MAFIPEDIRPALCSHFLYAFVGMEGNRLQPLEWNDEDMYEIALLIFFF